MACGYPIGQCRERTGPLLWQALNNTAAEHGVFVEICTGARWERSLLFWTRVPIKVSPFHHMTLWSCPLCCTRKSSLCLSDLVASCFRSRWSHRFQTSDSVTQPSRRATARESTFVLNHFVRKHIGQGQQSVVMFSPNTTELMHLQPRPECSSKNKAFIFLTFLGGLQDTYENDSWHFQESEPTEHLLREAGLKPDNDFSLATEPVSRTRQAQTIFLWLTLLLFGR